MGTRCLTQIYWRTGAGSGDSVARSTRRGTVLGGGFGLRDLRALPPTTRPGFVFQWLVLSYRGVSIRRQRSSVAWRPATYETNTSTLSINRVSSA
jgi:hypothetical protein